MQKTNVIHNIEQMIKADYPLISLISSEYNRTLQYIRHIASQNNADFYQWDCVNGLAKHSAIENSRNWKKQTIPDQEDYISLLKYLFYQTENNGNNKKSIYFIEDFHRYLNDIQVITYLRKIAEIWKSQNKHFIMCGTAAPLPKELEKFITLVDFPLPDYKDLSKLFEKVAGNQEIDEELEKYMIDAALGMTDMEADLAFRLAKQKNELKDKESVRIISSEKEQIIKKSGILDYYPVAEGLKEVGGLENLKNWLKQRHKAFEPKAKNFGLKEPKGIMLVGVPGCGKSLAAKATAAEWKLPLLRLDVGKIYQAEVGASESNLREAIKTAEAVAPCVLWIDEIEKGLGTGGERDGGTSSRVFATILSWMQEKEKPVFVFATANNLQQLPPELLRKGRFDEIFFVDLPTPKERENIFQIHHAFNLSQR
jgi:AAA+ superfamily predicted ATPase